MEHGVYISLFLDGTVSLPRLRVLRKPSSDELC